MTRVLKGLQAEGFVVDAAVLGGLAPYRALHINRFGDYFLDLERQVPPMQFETIIILNQSVTLKNDGFRPNPGRPFMSVRCSSKANGLPSKPTHELGYRMGNPEARSAIPIIGLLFWLVFYVRVFFMSS